MNAFKGKIWEYGGAMLYILLSFLSFYCTCYQTPVSLKYGVNLLVFAWACAAFFIHPQFDRAMFCMRFLAMFYFIYLMFWMWSVGIWISDLQDFEYIVRGSKNIIYMFTNLLYVCSTVYLFGEKTMNYTFIGMAMANFLCFVKVGLSYGFPTLIIEYVRLLLTFADDTGSAVRQLELHDMVYGWGACVIYYMTHREKNTTWQVITLGVSVFFFTLGFKRIAIPAVVGAVLLFYFLKKLDPKHLNALTTIIAVAAGVGAFLYLLSIKSRIFLEIADALDIDLMSRDILYTFFEDFYELSPTYLGRGVRFIYSYSTAHSDEVLTAAVHNVYLEFYIENGFWCWCVWLIHELSILVHRVNERYGKVPAYLLMAMNFYVFFTYLTDNTSFYFPPNVVYRMAVMTWCFEVMQAEDVSAHSMYSVKELKKIRSERAAAHKRRMQEET